METTAQAIVSKLNTVPVVLLIFNENGELKLF